VTSSEWSLALKQISKRFGYTQALNEASLWVRKGTVHALLGENGAGKTTLMRIAFGMVQPDHGVVEIGGTPVRLRSAADALARGVGMVHQHFTLVPAMTVAENVVLGHRGRFGAAEAATRVRELGKRTGLVVDPHVRVAELPVSAQQRVELLKVLSRHVNVLILDEPTAVLAPGEVDELLRQIRAFADAGRAVILITHKLREAISVADDVTVLRRGATTLTARLESVSEQQLVEAMLGHRASLPTIDKVVRAPGPTVIAAHGVSVPDARGALRVRDATFGIQAGEIVGVAAVEGSGHHELLRALAGRLRIAGGVLELPDTVGFVPDDRHRDGLVLDMSLVENYALNGAGRRRGMIPWRRLAASTHEVISQFEVGVQNEYVTARSLSGGNQQRLIIGRELHHHPPAVVADNPTRGLDLRSAAYVQQRLLQACADGVAIVVHSSDIDELLAIAHRMIVVFAGTVRETPVDRDIVGRAMIGAA